MDFVQPKKIASPWTGSWSTPDIKEFDHGDRIVVEAWWYCPDTGEFITKGVVEEKLKDKKE